MARWFPLESADGGFFDTAPHIFRYEKHYAAPPQRVWESMTSDESLAAWSATVSSLTWLSPRPFAVDSTREVALAPGLVRVRERYFRWDEGHGNSFYVYEANVPLFRRFAENYVLTPDGAGTRYTWTVAIEPKSALALPFKAIAPVLKAAFGRMAADGQRFFERTNSN
jgi:hypothetical protein